jgi:hypothetical protein
MAVLLPLDIHVKSKQSDVKQSNSLLLIVCATLLKIVGQQTKDQRQHA